MELLVIGLTILFVGLKLTGKIDWKWPNVLSPLILYVIFAFYVGFFAALSV